MIQFENAVNRYKKIILDELYEKAHIQFCWIAGGALRDYFAGVKIQSDYDLFFFNQYELGLAEQYFKLNGGEVLWESENGIKIRYNKRTYDLVKKYFESPQDTINQFDFTISMFAVDRDRIYHGETSFIDLAKRQLMINKITYPASTMSRVIRYCHKGYRICNGELKKIIEAIQDMPKDINADNDSEQEPTSGDTGIFFSGID